MASGWRTCEIPEQAFKILEHEIYPRKSSGWVWQSSYRYVQHSEVLSNVKNPLSTPKPRIGWMNLYFPAAIKSHVVGKYISIADSSWCLAETDTMLESNYPPIKNIKILKRKFMFKSAFSAPIRNSGLCAAPAGWWVPDVPSGGVLDSLVCHSPSLACFLR